MNATEKKYAVARLENIQAGKLRDLQKQYTVPATRVDGETLLQAILTGKVKVKDDAASHLKPPRDGLDRYGNPHYDGRGRAHLADLFDIEPYLEANEMPESVTAEGADVLKRFTELAEQCRDEIMLGDDQKALALLHQLAHWDPVFKSE